MILQAGLDLQIAVVQTAYANGSSTNYLENTMKVRNTHTRLATRSSVGRPTTRQVLTAQTPHITRGGGQREEIRD